MFAGLLLSTWFAACSTSDAEGENQERAVMGTFVELPYEPASSDNIPKWLVSRVDSLDRLSGLRIEVYQFEWGGNTWYYIMNPLNSCLFCEIYDKDGRNADKQGEVSKDELLRTSTNWKFILYR